MHFEFAKGEREAWMNDDIIPRRISVLWICLNELATCYDLVVRIYVSRIYLLGPINKAQRDDGMTGYQLTG